MNGWYDEMLRSAESGDISWPAYRRMVNVAIKDIAEENKVLTSKLDEKQKDIEALRDKIDIIEQTISEYPSILWSLRFDTKKTLIAIFLIVVIVLFLLGIIDRLFIQELVRGILGVP